MSNIDDYYSKMLAAIDPEAVKVAPKVSKLDKCKQQIKQLMEENHSIETTAEIVRCDANWLRRYCKDTFGMNWYNHNANCMKRKQIMREALREQITGLYAAGNSYKVIATELGVDPKTIGNYMQYYRRTDK